MSSISTAHMADTIYGGKTPMNSMLESFALLQT